jgi:hypothetical protein
MVQDVHQYRRCRGHFLADRAISAGIQLSSTESRRPFGFQGIKRVKNSTPSAISSAKLVNIMMQK